MQHRDEIIQQFLESTGRMYRSMLPVKNQYLSELGLNRSQFEVMMYLNHSSKVTIKDVSHAFSMTSSAATQIIETLVLLGFVNRIESKEDRRVTNVSLNKKGETKCHAFKKHIFTYMTKKLTDISDQELQDITLIAQKITKNTEGN